MEKRVQVLKLLTLIGSGASYAFYRLIFNFLVVGAGRSDRGSRVYARIMRYRNNL